MVTVGVLARLEAKPGREEEVARFLEGALPLAQQEEATTAWFAIRMGPSTFGIFDVFPDEPGREAHLAGPIASALMQRADELLTEAADDREGGRPGEQAQRIGDHAPSVLSRARAQRPQQRPQLVRYATRRASCTASDPDRRINCMHDKVRCSNATYDRHDRASGRRLPRQRTHEQRDNQQRHSSVA